MHVIVFPSIEKKKNIGSEEIHKEINIKIFPKIMKDIKLQIQEVQ